jgi:hypothetical protein
VKADGLIDFSDGFYREAASAHSPGFQPQRLSTATM